jgi:hypothetical protein
LLIQINSVSRRLRAAALIISQIAIGTLDYFLAQNSKAFGRV